MRLVRTHLAVLEPLLDCAVLIPSVVPRQSFLERCTWVLEYLILTLEDCNCLDGLLIWVLCANVIGTEARFALHMLMSLIDSNMSGRKSLIKKAIIKYIKSWNPNSLL